MIGARVPPTLKCRIFVLLFILRASLSVPGGHKTECTFFGGGWGALAKYRVIQMNVCTHQEKKKLHNYFNTQCIHTSSLWVK